jgi:hypothetical protein
LKYKHDQTIISHTEFQKDKNGDYLMNENDERIPLVRYVAPQWEGYSKDTMKPQFLLEDAAKQCATPKFLEQLKRLSVAKNHVFVEIPPGANNIHREFPVGIKKGPEIHYVQKEGEHTCLVTSLASLLYYVNARKDAHLLFTSRDKI